MSSQGSYSAKIAGPLSCNSCSNTPEQMISAETRDRDGDSYMAENHQVDFSLSPEESQEEGEDLVKKLLRIWMNERGAPEILPFQFEVIQDIMELINVQVLFN